MDIVKLKKFRYRSSVFSKNLLLAGAVWFFSVSCLGQHFVFAQTWQETLEQQFDIVETFDQLQDWRGVSGLRGYDYDKNNMPKKLDGSASIWDFYDDWSYADPAEDWIKFHGADKVWRGSGKSLHIQLDGSSTEPLVGPSRFGLYFGSGTPGQVDGYATSGLASSGYKNIYYFYMVKISKNMFPTLSGGLWPEDGYKWWSYHKFATMSAGFLDVDSPAGAGGCRVEYGCSYVLTELKLCGSNCVEPYNDNAVPSHDIRIVDFNNPVQEFLQVDVVVKNGVQETTISTSGSDQVWFGIEYHIVSGTPGNYDGSIETWIYKEDGTVYKFTDQTGLMIMQEGTDIAYNKFFFGGNISYIDDANSQGLDVSYYVDDFIIDDQRIGPTYFQLLAGNTVKMLTVEDVQPSPGVWVNR